MLAERTRIVVSRVRGKSLVARALSNFESLLYKVVHFVDTDTILGLVE